MSSDIWDDIARHMAAHEYMQSVGSVNRKINRAVFTPTPLVLEIVRNLPEEALGRGKKVLDPACGDGQFLVAAKWVKILRHRMSEADALGDLFGIDIMRDNVDVC